MKKDLDWTNSIDQNKIAKIANTILNEIIKDVHHSKIQVFNKWKLSQKEIDLIYSFSINKFTHIFIDRLLISLEKVKKKKIFYFPYYRYKKREKNFYKDTNLAILNCYYNLNITHQLLNNILFILDKNYKPKKIKKKQLHNIHVLYKESTIPVSIKLFIKYLFKKKDEFIFRIMKPNFILESSSWTNNYFSFWNYINFSYHNFDKDKQSINFEIRSCFKKSAKKIFKKHIKKNKILNNELIIEKISDLFAEHIDQLLPVSLIEGLDERLKYYKGFLKKSKIKFIHSFTALTYEDNFKIFSLLAKRKKAKSIVNCHGLNNYGYGNSGFSYNLYLKHANYFSNYGSYKNFINFNENKKLKVVNLGSVPFYNIKKWEKKRNSDYTILYPSGPLMDFKTDLQEISPEKNLTHRIKVLNFLDKILKRYSSVQIIYKPFFGTYENDPIKLKFSNWIKKGRVKIVDSESTKLKNLYPKADVVLWDTISTGFGECVASNTPILIFNNQFEYKQTSKRGKFINNLLTRCKIQFFDIENGIKSFDAIFKNNFKTQKVKNTLNMIIKDKINPVSGDNWKLNFIKYFRLK